MRHDDFDDEPYERYEPEPAPSGFCDACGEECTAVCVDFGIGAYEYWGAPGVHVDKQWVSPCCEAEVVSEKPELEEPCTDTPIHQT